ncbi:MAG: carbohydrate kinase family protein [Rhizobiales bacterium]|nr:carbohydrate kinase family protein [Hyphomicrobiales bacterium]
MTKRNVLTIGSAMVDIITIIADHDVERVTLQNATTTFLLVEPGRKIEAESITIHVGGGAVNVGVSMRRQGANVDVLSKLGNDINAERIRAHFEREDLSPSQIIETNEVPTGSSVMIAAHDRDAAIYTQRGSNTCLTPADIGNCDMSQYDLVYVSPLSKASAACFPVAIAAARKAGCYTVATPGIRQITMRAPEVLSAMGQLDLTVMNMREAEALTPALMTHFGECPMPARASANATPGMPERLRKGMRLADEHIPLQWVMQSMLSTGLKRVALTDGGHGAYLCDGEHIHHCPVHDVQVMGTAGAGDAYCSTLAYGLFCGLEVGEAMMRAAVNAAGVVSHADTQTGLMSDDELATAVRSAPDLTVTSWPL